MKSFYDFYPFYKILHCSPFPNFPLEISDLLLLKSTSVEIGFRISFLLFSCSTWFTGGDHGLLFLYLSSSNLFFTLYISKDHLASMLYQKAFLPCLDNFSLIPQFFVFFKKSWDFDTISDCMLNLTWNFNLITKICEFFLQQPSLLLKMATIVMTGAQHQITMRFM